MKQVIFLILCLFFSACKPQIRKPHITTTTTYTNNYRATITLTPTTFPTQINSGLVIVTRQLAGEPTLDPLSFVTAQGKSLGFADMGKGEYFNFQWLEGGQIGLWVELDGHRLVATENYGNSGMEGWVTVTRDGQEIYRIDTDKASPISALRGLWVYDDHWVLETNSCEDENPYNGKIIEDGLLLDEQFNYKEAFGFQTIHERPFYFFKQDEIIDAWYDERVIPLGYEEIPHYGCCSAAELNPHIWQEMISFFGIRSGTWYFVQIGTPESFTP